MNKATNRNEVIKTFIEIEKKVIKAQAEWEKSTITKNALHAAYGEYLAFHAHHSIENDEVENYKQRVSA